MSLILDALNRADQERSEENHTPNLHASHEPMPAAANPIRRWVIEAVIILLAAAAFIYSQWFSELSVAVVPAPVVETPAAQPAVIKPTTPTAEKIVMAPPSTRSKPIPAATNTVATPASTEIPSTVVATKTLENTSIASLYQQPLKTQPAPPTAGNALPQAIEEVDNTLSILQQMPLITDLSSRLQRSIPSINYSIHMYSENDASGFVKLNGSIHKIGSVVLPDLRVIAILRDSVVLDYKGIQFRLPSLNSWANYN